MKVKWDCEELIRYRDNVRRQIQIMRENESFLRSINEKVNEAWQGLAGTAFDQVLKLDIQNYEQVIDSVVDLNDDVDKATNNYSLCEQDILEMINCL